MDLVDVHRLAQSAHDIATKAQHSADMVDASGKAHEQLCSERYAVINEKLSDVKRAQGLAADDQKTKNKDIFDKLEAMKAKLDKASGLDLAFRYLVTFLGAFGTLFGIMKAMH